MRFLGTIVAALFMASQAFATTLLSLSFDELARMSDGIVMATVDRVVSKKYDRGDIYTFMTLADLKVFSGQYDGRTLTLQFEGGEVESEKLEVVGSPQFKEKERVILFVQGNGQRTVPIVGWGQGIFRVIRDPKTGTEVISDHLGNRVFGIRNGQVIKEHRVASKVELFGGWPSGPAQAEMPKGDFGRTETGEKVSMDEEAMMGIKPDAEMQALVKAGEVITLDQFIKEIRDTIATLGLTGKVIQSVDMDRATLSSLEDGKPQPGVGLEEPKLLPPERGEYPRSIEMDTGVNPDLQQ